MERWKKEAASIVEATDEAVLEASKLYVLLRVGDLHRLSQLLIQCQAQIAVALPGVHAVAGRRICDALRGRFVWNAIINGAAGNKKAAEHTRSAA
jgi:hypothetical protein